MKVAVFGKTFKPEVSKYILKLFETLERNNLEVLIYEPFYNFLSKSVIEFPTYHGLHKPWPITNVSGYFSRRYSRPDRIADP